MLEGLSGEEPGTTHIWIPGQRPEPEIPIRQVYLFAFDEQGRVLLQRDARGRFNLPGGKPEPGDKGELATLRRECWEESQFRFRDARYLGYVRVQAHSEIYAQLRYIGSVNELLPTAPDPATGEEYERVFVALDEVAHCLAWGDHGAAQLRSVEAAVEVDG